MKALPLFEARADTPWRRVRGRVELPPTAKTLKVAIGPNRAAGVIDFDGIEVQFCQGRSRDARSR